MSTPYGEHAEHIADALAELVKGPALPDDPSLRPVVLTSRDVVIGALRDRLWNQFVVQVKNTDPAASTPTRFDTLQRAPVIELGYLVEQFPRMAPTERLAPSDALSEVTDPVARHWVDAAKEILAANHVLNTTETQPWRTTSTAQAALAGDTAQIIEAIAVIDQRLRTTGALDNHTLPDSGRPSDVTTARLVASSVERYAHWVGDRHLVDVAFTPPARPFEFDQPVHMVRAPDDLAPAQRSLDSFLRPMAQRNLEKPYRISASTALAIAHNQANLLARLHDRIANSPDLHSDLARVEHVRDLLDDALYANRGLHDATGPRINPFVRGQQQEISVAVKQGHIDALNDDQTTNLLVATERILSTWAAALRREASRDFTDLRVMRRGTIEQTVYGRLAPDGPAVRSLTALAEHQPAAAEAAPSLSANARSQLRDTLAHTPPFEILEAWPNPGRRNADRQSPAPRPAPREGRRR